MIQWFPKRNESNKMLNDDQTTDNLIADYNYKK